MNVITRIVQFFTRKNSTIKVAAMILIIGIFFVGSTWAQTPHEPSLLEKTQERLDMLIGFLSWVWIFLAIIAGKLMTNEFVYGSFMHLDKYLWNIWNIMKNFANFGLAFLILISIVQYVFNKGQAGATPQKIVTNALIAGVLIQMSRFAVGALVDLSSIATAAISSFPANFIAKNNIDTSIKTELSKMADKQYTIEFEDDGSIKWKPLQRTQTAGACDVNDIGIILPKYDSVSGPLIFLGMSSLKIQNYMTTDTFSMGEKAGSLIINFVLKALILVFFTLTLLLLCIANLIRIVFLRILILGSPLVILMAVFEKKMGSKEGGLTGYFSVPVFLNLIFKPVIVIGFLALTLIFVSTMQNIMGDGKGMEDMNGVSITGNTNTAMIKVAGIADLEIDQNVFQGIADVGSSAFVDLLIIFMTLFLLRSLLKRSLALGKGPVEDIMQKITPLIQQWAGNIPFVPMPGQEGKFGLEALGKAAEKSVKNVVESAGIRAYGTEKGTFFESEEAFKRNIEEKRLGMQPSWNSTDLKNLEVMINRGDNFWEEYIKTGKGKQGGLSLGNEDQLKLMEKWYNKYRTSPEVISQIFGTRPTNDETSFKKYLDGEGTIKIERRKRLHNLLGGSNAMTPTRGETYYPTTYDELAGIKYYAGTE